MCSPFAVRFIPCGSRRKNLVLVLFGVQEGSVLFEMKECTILSDHQKIKKWWGRFLSVIQKADKEVPQQNELLIQKKQFGSKSLEKGVVEMARQGLFLIYTGEGKGKTTASLGVTLRAIGRGMNVKYFQFIKSPERTYGEALALRKLGVEMEQLGIGFTWTKTPEEHREALKKAWAKAKEELGNPETDLLV